ncbi:hypothetical protein NPIL_656571, partial [Nephila pilipes]
LSPDDRKPHPDITVSSQFAVNSSYEERRPEHFTLHKS